MSRNPNQQTDLNCGLDLTHLEELQGSVSDGVQVGWGLVSPLVTVEGSHDGSVHHQPLVGVDTDTEQARVGVDLKNLVTGSQIVEDAGPASVMCSTVRMEHLT